MPKNMTRSISIMHTFASLTLFIGVLCLSGAQLTGVDNPLAKQSGCSCGIQNGAPDTKIVGGQEAKQNQFPWRTALYEIKVTRSRRDGERRPGRRPGRGPGRRPGRGPSRNPVREVRSLFCTATLIHEKWVVTAAHCVRQLKTTDFRIGFGNHDIRGVETNSMERTASRIIVHPNYNTKTLENDIALLELAVPVTFNTYISPVCLPFGQEGNTFSGKKVVASGWGVTRQGGGDSGKTLLKVVLDVILNKVCDDQYPQHIKNSMMCTYTAGKDTCQGDSGSGLDYYAAKSQTMCMVGVVSFGDGCAKPNKAGVYTRVTSYLDWILENTKANFCKNCIP